MTYNITTKEQMKELIYEIIEIDGDLLTDGGVIDLIYKVVTCPSNYVTFDDEIAEVIGELQ